MWFRFMRHRLALLGIASLPFSGVAQPSDWPNRQIRIIYNYAPGTPDNGLTRMIAAHVATKLGQPIVVENRAGASGTLGV